MAVKVSNAIDMHSRETFCEESFKEIYDKYLLTKDDEARSTFVLSVKDMIGRGLTAEELETLESLANEAELEQGRRETARREVRKPKEFDFQTSGRTDEENNDEDMIDHEEDFEKVQNVESQEKSSIVQELNNNAPSVSAVSIDEIELFKMKQDEFEGDLEMPSVAAPDLVENPNDRKDDPVDLTLGNDGVYARDDWEYPVGQVDSYSFTAEKSSLDELQTEPQIEPITTSESNEEDGKESSEVKTMTLDGPHK